MKIPFIQSQLQTSTFQWDAATVHPKLKWHYKYKILYDAATFLKMNSETCSQTTWFTSERANSLKVRARGLHATTNKPLTSSAAWASRPGEGGGLDTSGQNCSRKCLDACGLLCSPWRLPRVGARWASRERLSSCCGDVLPLIRCHTSWSFYTWSAYSGTIFSPRKRGKLINTTAVNNQHQ